KLYAWSRDPAAGSEFGVFVDPLGQLHDDTQKDLNLNQFFAANSPIRTLQDVARITGLALATPGHLDKLRFVLPAAGTAADSLLVPQLPGAGALLVRLFDLGGATPALLLTRDPLNSGATELPLAGLVAGRTYELQISLLPSSADPADFQPVRYQVEPK